MKLSQWNFSTIASGEEYKCFPYWTRNKRNLLWLVYSSFIIIVAFCSVSLTCPPVNGFILLKHSSKQSWKIQQNYFSLVRLGPYWNDMWFLLNLVPVSDWLLHQQGLVMLPCWQQICALRLPPFWYKISHFLAWQSRKLSIILQQWIL